MKRTLFLLIFIIYTVQNLHGVILDGINYELDARERSASVNTTVFLTKDSVIIPEEITYDGFSYTVKKIDRFAFGANDSYKYVKLPHTIVEIENCAFASKWDFKDGMPLKIVDLSDCINLYYLPDSLFFNGSYGRSSLENVYLPNSISRIGDYAFYNCECLRGITLPEQLIEIGCKSFASTRLYSIVIPKEVTYINESAFQGCSLLSTIVYLPTKAPTSWTATSETYVPDIVSYSQPKVSMNNAKVIEMITFMNDKFEYKELLGKAPLAEWRNNIAGYTASLALENLSGDAGNHEEQVPVVFTKNNESFTTNVIYRYTINPAQLIAKINNYSREYGDDNPEFRLTYFGFVNGENESAITTRPSVNTAATKNSDVGSYPITVSGGVAKNYEFMYEHGVLTVTKAPLSAKVKDTTKIYGTRNPAFTIEYYGLKNNETIPTWNSKPTFQTEATQSSEVGRYDVKAINAEPVNYTLGEITTGSLNITKAPLIIKANNATRQYFCAEPIFSYTCSGFVNGDDESVFSTIPVVSTTANIKSNVGAYEIRVSGDSCHNYSISYINGTLTITPRTLVAFVDNYERSYNEENPEFEIKYNGFVDDENYNVLIQEPIAYSDATRKSDVGSYTIKISGGIADNYTFSYIPGVITINKAEQSISWEQDLSDLKIGEQVELLASASSGLPITYTIDGNNDIAEVYTAGTKTYLDCKSSGKFYIRAVQNGNKNYYSSPRAVNNVSIIDGQNVNNVISNSKRSNIKILSTSEGVRVVDANIGDDICVYNIIGILQQSVKVNANIIDIPLKKGNCYIFKVGTETKIIRY